MINRLHYEMIRLYSGDPMRIQHFCKVHSYAKLIAEMEQKDLDGYTEDEQQPTLAALIQAAGCAEDDVIISESGKLCYIPLGQE